MKTQLKKGFTLVEIMIVVVIIGLLAALAIPAFKKVRNNAIEKTLINDARQISSAAQQFCSENATTVVAPAEVTKFLNGNNLSSGVLVAPGKSRATVTIGALAVTDLFAIDGTAAYFTLTHAQYDRTISSNIKLSGQTSAPDTNSIVFQTVDGQPNP